MAWIAASTLYAVQLKADPTNIAVLPGPLAYNACGVAGLLCVILAGWTTANPTLYRSGLAFQSLMPKVSPAKVTFATGIVATLTAIFPFVTMNLLGFVALWGIILMPMGAVIFADYWLLPRLGMKRDYADSYQLPINKAAAVAWAVSVASCLSFIFMLGESVLYFACLPGWFIAVISYTFLSKLQQK